MLAGFVLLFVGGLLLVALWIPWWLADSMTARVPSAPARRRRVR